MEPNYNCSDNFTQTTNDNPQRRSDNGSIITNNEELRIVLVGKTGVGKSSTGNTILGRECFVYKFSANSITVDCDKGKAVIDGQKVSVIDTPGLFDTRFNEAETSTNLKQCIAYASPGPHIFLVVIQLGRFTNEEKQTVQKIQEIFGQSADRYSMVLFTRGDELDCTIDEFLDSSLELQELVNRCNGQFHVFKNKSKDCTQVTELLQKIRNVVQKNGGSHFTSEMFQQAERAVEAEKQRILKEDEEKTRREREEIERKIERKYQEKMDNIMQKIQAEKTRETIEKHEEKARQEKLAILTMMINQIREEHRRLVMQERLRDLCRRLEEARRRAEMSANPPCVIL